MTAVEGLLLVDKALGPTSHDVVVEVRRRIGQSRIGHTGTLDPAASGLLILVLGRATRLTRFLPHEPKTYHGSLELGWSTDTNDATGQIIARHTGPYPDPESVRAAAFELLGVSDQVPPAFSARKVAGQRLYAAARRGLSLEAKPSRIAVSRLDFSPTSDPVRFDFVAEVSTGTYIRALARDLGERLGCGATLTRLRRTAIGPFEVHGAMLVPRGVEAESDALLSGLVPLQSLPLALRSIRLNDENEVRWFVHGRLLEVHGGDGDWVAVRGPDGSLLGVGQTVAEGLRVRLVL